MLVISLTVFVLVLAINTFFLKNSIDSLRKVTLRNTALLADLQLKTSNMQSDISCGLEAFQKQVMTQLSRLEAAMARKDAPVKELSVSIKRKPRTQEQKELASKIMKERWAKRRQEQKASIPDVIEITQKLPQPELRA